MSEAYTQPPLFAHEKRCTRCNNKKPLDRFNRQAASADGLKSWCRACCAVYRKDWYAKNRDHAIAYAAQYFKSHRDRYREQARQRLRSNSRRREANNRRAAAWRLLHPDANREYVEKNRLRLNARGRERYRHDPTKVIGRIAKRRARQISQSVGDVDFAEILRRDGRVCHLCGGDIGFARGELHFDHVIPLSKGGPHSMDNIRPSHRSCNIRKKDRIIPSMADQNALEDKTGKSPLK